MSFFFPPSFPRALVNPAILSSRSLVDRVTAVKCSHDGAGTGGGHASRHARHVCHLRLNMHNGTFLTTKTGIFDVKKKAKSTPASFSRSLASVLAATISTTAFWISCVYPTAHPLKEKHPKEQIHLRSREPPAFLSPRSLRHTHQSPVNPPWS